MMSAYTPAGYGPQEHGTLLYLELAESTPPVLDRMSSVRNLLRAADVPVNSSAIDLSILVPARRAEHCLEETCRRLHETMSSYREPGTFEIIIILNSRPGDGDATSDVAADVESRYDEVMALNAPGSPGKGAALQWGAKLARGQVIAFMDADLPFGPDFLERASRAVEKGADLVVANRRLTDSDLNLRPSLLFLGYRRHLLGKAFNRLVRVLLPIQSTDTQAGAKAMSRRLALKAFEQVTCPGFLFDLEIFLCAANADLPVVDLPVTMRLRTEESTVSIIRQSARLGYWLARIVLRNLRGCYSLEPVVTAAGIRTGVVT